MVGLVMVRVVMVGLILVGLILVGLVLVWQRLELNSELSSGLGRPLVSGESDGWMPSRYE